MRAHNPVARNRRPLLGLERVDATLESADPRFDPGISLGDGLRVANDKALLLGQIEERGLDGAESLGQRGLDGAEALAEGGLQCAEAL